MKFIAQILASVALLGVTLPGRAAAVAAKPNIVYILADDWGWGDLSSHGHPWLQTPQLDRLAREGIDFQQYNVLNPVCSPSRTAATTGMFPARFCVHEHFAPGINVQRGMPDWLDPQAPTLARFLQQAGYRTGHFGKWHLTNSGAVGAPLPSAYGFDASAVFNGPGVQGELHDTAGNAVRFMRESKGRPFYVNVWLHESHTPHVPTPESMARWKDLDEQKQVYAAVITDGDNAVGQILDALRQLGVEDNTLVVFSSDNGPEWTGGPDKKGRPGRYDTYYSIGETGGLRGRKRSLFEGGVRVPFIVRWPGHTPAGVKNEKTVVTAVDLLPTLCAVAGVTLPADYRGDGENLLDAFRGMEVARTRPSFWEWRGNKTEPDWWPRLAVREGDWKLALTYDASRVELHRLSEDRAEAKDVAKENPAIVARLTKLALDWKASLPEKPNPDCISKSAAAPKVTGVRGKSVDAVAAMAAGNPFLGHWALTLPDGNAGWLGVEERNGQLHGGLLWGGGDVKPAAAVKIEGDRLVITRAQGPPGAAGKGKGKTRKDEKITETITATVSGDDLKLEIVKAGLTGPELSRGGFTGRRTSPLPPRPDVSKVVYGAPIALFNGQDLSGWKPVNSRVPMGWSVEAGVLINRTHRDEGGPRKPYANIQTEREFEDFNLSLEVRALKNSNSGAYLRGIYEVQLAESQGKAVNVHNMGAIYGRICPTVAAEKPMGEWQTLDITLVDRHVTVVLNGQTIIDNQPVPGCTGGALWSDPFRPGPIVLQGNHSDIDFRKIVLRPVVNKAVER